VLLSNFFATIPLRRAPFGSRNSSFRSHFV